MLLVLTNTSVTVEGGTTLVAALLKAGGHREKTFIDKGRNGVESSWL
jgi:hypothetical protein